MNHDRTFNQQELKNLDQESVHHNVYGWFIACNLARNAYSTMLWVGYGLSLAMLPFSYAKIAKLLILTVAYVPTMVTCLLLPFRKVSTDWMRPHIQWTAFLTLLACGALFACFIIASHQTSDAQYLAWLWYGAVVGMVLIAITLFVQLFHRRLRKNSILWIVIGDACVLAMVSVLRATMAALTVTDLHLIIANIFLTKDAGGSDDISRNDHDEHWLEGHRQDR